MRAEDVPTSVTSKVYETDALGFRLSQNQFAELISVAWDAIAHHLAEEIRGQVDQFREDGILEPDKDWTASGAANLIDPDYDFWGDFG